MEDDPRRFVSGLVLAAGGARRMGRTKQLLAFGDGTILQSVIESALAAALDEVVVVLGHECGRVRDALSLPAQGRLRALVHEGWAEGQGGSLRAGLAGLDPRATAAAVLLGDQPDIEPGLIDRVLDEAAGCPLPIHRPVHVTQEERVPGHPVVLARSVWSAVRALDGDEGARALIRAHPEWLCAVDVDTPPPADVDTPADYDRLCGRPS
jgi:molybdenum cofactor cytidylyltransferase